MEQKHSMDQHPTFVLNEQDKAKLSRTLVRAVLLSCFHLFSAWLIMYVADKLPVFSNGQTIREWLGISPKYYALLRSVVLGFVVGLSAYRIYNTYQIRANELRVINMSSYMEYIAKGHYDVRIPTVRVGKMSYLIHRINEVVAKADEMMIAERLEEKEKDEFIANIGHDIRTPVTAIVGYLGLLKDHKYQTESERDHYISVSYQRSKQLQQLVSDFFEYTLYQDKSYELQMSTMDVSLFLSQIAMEVEYDLEAKGLALSVDLPDGEFDATFDAEKMARIFNNLISNALKYGKGATEIKLKAYQQGQDVVFAVQNNGELLDDEELKRIFQRSYRGDKSRNAQAMGTGLGLAIVRSIAELHKGHANATVEGNFLSFNIIIPQK
ncbi:MAG: HAMP domain-containing sensor histidine kinase [Aerococcaceae bacterium]|nr:HAMP domain-containing sensor histidine kinase [Aerococcaceae bacterium]